MELQNKLPQFEERGMQVIAVTSNSRELAEASVRDWELNELTVGYGLTLEDAARWGLFVSQAVKDSEPPYFTEPGIFVVRPDGTLYASIVQTMPFARPSAGQLLKSLEFIIEKDYPARGEAAPVDL